MPVKPIARAVLVLFAAVGLNGSVAMAVTQPACTGQIEAVCALPVDLSRHPASLTRPGAMAEIAYADAAFAPPARPADLLARHARAAANATDAVAEARSSASFPPPARPTQLPQATDQEL